MILESISRQSSTEATKRNSGYEVLLIEPSPDRLICPLCKKLMRNPVQTYRGELSCKYCYQANQTDVTICPIDHEPVPPVSFHRDKFQELVIQQLRCVCINRERGCHWQGTVADVESHQENCPHIPATCYFCKQQLTDSCITDIHLQNCPALVGRETCIYDVNGCKFKPSSVVEHLHHLKENNYLHAFLQQKSFHHHKLQCEVLKKKLQQKDEEMQSINNEMNAKILSLTDTLTVVLKEMEKMKERMVSSNTKLIELSSMCERSTETINMSDVANMENEIAEVNAKISTLDLKQQLTENTTYDGRIMWKIDNVANRMQQAVTGRVTALHSAPCFTSKYGFKMCGRLYLNGDGMGKCSHVSLFLVVMKSQYDNLLEWPFNKHVMFKLINQEDYSKTIQESFIPDGESSSFKQPTREMNVAAGCPLFISKEKLMSEGFIKDDSLFIEISAK